MQEPPRRILVRVPTWIGDAVMATPVFRALRAAHPQAEITLEGRPVLEPLLRGLPSFDRFLADPGSGFRAAVRRMRNLRELGFDWAVLLPDSPRAALGPFLARVGRRVGYARDPVRRLLLTGALAPATQDGRRLPIPMTERYLRITRSLGVADAGHRLELAVSPEATERCRKALQRHGVDERDEILVVTPGAGFGASKLWPTEHFAAACDAIQRRLGLVPVLAPGPSELDIARRIADQASQPLVALLDPSPDLEQVKALVARASLVLSNDTGPRHIAVALGRPVVVLMGPTDPRHTAQHLERQRVLREEVSCSPCQLKTCPIDHRCMTRLQPARALAAAEDLLSTPPR